MRYLLFLFALASLPISAQVNDRTLLFGDWEMTKYKNKPTPDYINMKLVIRENLLIISNGFQTVESSWDLSYDKNYILCSNDDSDEEWKIISINHDKLVLKDKSNVMEFSKTAIYNPENENSLIIEKNDHNIIENEKLIMGDWSLKDIDGKSVNENLSLSFRPRGSIYYNFNGEETAASWTLSEDKRSINMVAYNGQSEKWDVKNYKSGFLQIYTHGKVYTFIRK